MPKTSLTEVSEEVQTILTNNDHLSLWRARGVDSGGESWGGYYAKNKNTNEKVAAVSLESAEAFIIEQLNITT